MKSIKQFFASRYKKLLHQIKCAKENEQRLQLPNGVVLDFTPGHEYDKRVEFLEFPHEDEGESFFKKYSAEIGGFVHIDVYDCFSGVVKVLAIGTHEIFVEIVDVSACYWCQKAPSVGSKYWISEWEIPKGAVASSCSVFQDSDLPF